MVELDYKIDSDSIKEVLCKFIFRISH